ncbi:amidohydrolase [Emergencia sp.]|uniref:amidohydrolase n=1 Tax=Emergencia sp. TaxID=1926557 RepID=UPI003AEFDC90
MSKYVEYRREFHKYPEQGFREIRTSARIAEILTEMGYQCLMGPDVVKIETIGTETATEEEMKEAMERAVSQGAKPEFVEKTKGYPGVIAEFDTGRDGPVTAFRFDIDCLPYDEPKKEGYRPFEEGYVSCNDGSVHACGHDSHTAMGLGIADKLMAGKEQFKGKIRLIFQPAEETFNGAQSIIDKGHLDDVEYFIAMHVALSAENRPLPSNTIACGCKDFLSDRQLDVTFHGRAAHPCGAAQEGKNALLAACTAALNLHAIAPHEEGLCRVNVGELYAGVAPNTIAPNALMKVEYRGQTPAIAAYAGKRVFDILDGAAKAYDMTYTYLDYGEVPAGKSDDAMMEVIQRAAKKVPWFEKIYFEGNVGGTDDAAAMITKVQQNGGMGTYIGIGSDTTQPVHNAEFDIDEDCIDAAIDLCMFALEELHGIG